MPVMKECSWSRRRSTGWLAAGYGMRGERWIGFPSTPGERDSRQTLARQVPESSVRDELRQGVLVALDVPSMKATMPITAVQHRNGYLSAVAKR